MKKQTPVVDPPVRMIRHSMNFKMGTRPGDYEQSIGISLTVPDMSMPLKTIIERYRRGLPVNQLMPVYSDLDVPNIRSLDLVDIEAYRDSVESDIFDLRELYKKNVKTIIDTVKSAKNAKRQAQQLADRKEVLSEKDNPIPDGVQTPRG
jgi:hypothetical protein